MPASPDRQRNWRDILDDLGIEEEKARKPSPAQAAAPPPPASREKIEAPWHDPFVHMAQEAVNWVDGKIDDPISSGQKGRATIEVLMAIYESARKRRRIDLPLKTLANPLQLMVDAGELPVEWPGAYETRSRIVRGEGFSWQ